MINPFDKDKYRTRETLYAISNRDKIVNLEITKKGSKYLYFGEERTYRYQYNSTSIDSIWKGDYWEPSFYLNDVYDSLKEVEEALERRLLVNKLSKLIHGQTFKSVGWLNVLKSSTIEDVIRELEQFKPT
jgi:hypothetical protein